MQQDVLGSTWVKPTNHDYVLTCIRMFKPRNPLSQLEKPLLSISCVCNSLFGGNLKLINLLQKCQHNHHLTQLDIYELNFNVHLKRQHNILEAQNKAVSHFNVCFSQLTLARGFPNSNK